MKIRKLEEKDAQLMLEWMKDEQITCCFQRFNSDNATLASALNFIRESYKDMQSYHFAIVDDNDEYQGTVSLKNVDPNSKNGEYAIVLRSNGQGQGKGRFATEKILQYAFETLNLERVYLNVLSENKQAINFYEKFGFTYEGEFYKHVNVNNQLKSLKWYRMMRSEYETR